MRKKKREGGESNELSEFIGVMYNVIMILLWYAFAAVYYSELHRFGFKLTME